MSDHLIARLRDATGAVAETVQDVPPLAPRPIRRSWLVPVVAALTVAAVAVGVALAVPRADVATFTAPDAPDFFTLTQGPHISVRRVSDGQEVAVIGAPAGGERYEHVVAAQDNRTFYAVTAKSGCSPRFYRFTLSDTGEPTFPEPLRIDVPQGTRPMEIAVSGDGRRLAYALVGCRDFAGTGKLVVADTATGESRTCVRGDQRADRVRPGRPGRQGGAPVRRRPVAGARRRRDRHLVPRPPRPRVLRRHGGGGHRPRWLPVGVQDAGHGVLLGRLVIAGTGPGRAVPGTGRLVPRGVPAA